MDQIAQKVALGPRSISFTADEVPNEKIPLRARAHVVLVSFPRVLTYHCMNVHEQILFGFWVSIILGALWRLILGILHEKRILASSDPFSIVFIPLVILVCITLAQERLAVRGHRLADPLTKKVRWRALAKRYSTLSAASEASHNPPEDKVSETQLFEEEEESPQSSEIADVVPEFIQVPKREFNAAQEASINALVEKFFNPALPIWSRTQYLCVNDDGRWAAIRALDARKWKLDQATQLIEGNIKWREKDQVDNILLKEIPAGEVHTVRSAMSDGFFGLDRTMTPIYWCPAGMVNLSTLTKQVPLENIVAIHVQLVEYNHRVYFKELSQKQNRCVYQSTCVLDLKGFSSKNTSGGFWDCMQAISTIDKDFYYENLFRVYILHAPMFFRFFWNSVSQLLQPETRQKFVFLANEKSLSQYIDPKITPKQFGGEYAGDDALYSATLKDGTQHSKMQDAYMQELRSALKNTKKSSSVLTKS